MLEEFAITIARSDERLAHLVNACASVELHTLVATNYGEC